MTTRRYREVATEIRALIAAEGLGPGDRLLAERALSDSLGVSRSIVREALLLLEIEGFVTVRKGSGVYITDRAQTDIVQMHDDIGPFELLQARQVLEAEVAGFAARMVTKNDISRMRAALEQERRDIAGGGGDYSGDRAFHRLIAEATQNSVLVDMVEILWQKREQSPMWASLHRRVFDTTYRQDWLSDHRAILEAIRARASDDARAAMWQHLENVRETLMTLSDVEDPQFDGYLFESVGDP